jgi:alpha-tubulin suppressor-like RCC1 family protein
VSAGSEHTCGITTAGAAYCWGIDNMKQLGHDNGDQGAPNFPVNGALTYQSIEAGPDHTCAMTTDDQLVCWGYNNNGELGTGSMDWALSSPALVNTPVSFQQLGLAWEVTCGITASDQTWCWGQRGPGMLGDGVPGYYLTPGDVSIPLSVATDGLGDPENYVCHIATDGSTYCAGRNDSGQLGDGTTIDRYTLAPVLTGQTFTQVDVGNWSHTCAINTVGEAYCWGNGGSGQLGDGAYDQQLTPTLVSGGYTWQDISAHDQTCGVTTGGALYCWGSNWRGQAGQGTDNNSYNVPTLVDDTHNWTQVEASQGYGCGLTDTGDAYCWGSDWDCVGLLGTGSYCTTYAAPSLVAGGHQFSKISVGEWHACGITTTGEGYCWGQNNRGELGNGNQNNQSTPVRAGILLYSDIDVGDNSTCATKTDGTEVCWGGNDNGDLGTGNWNDTSSPTFLAGGIDFATIRTGRGATCGVTFANQLYCWGNRGFGVFGDGFAGFTTSPAQVIGH